MSAAVQAPVQLRRLAKVEDVIISTLFFKRKEGSFFII